MNKWEREITKYQLEDEKRTIAELKAVYSKAREDLKARIEELGVRYDETGLESVIYQKKYQEAIKSQVDGALNQLLSKEYTTIDDFLKDSYNNGFVGNMYLLHQQKIPLAIPIDNKSVVKALQTDSKLSRRYYKGNPLRNRVNENVDVLKTRVRSNLSRGIAQGQSWGDIAVNIASGMNSPMRRALNDSIRIARTEGHRVQQQGFLDAGFEAIKNGADVLKQWDATLDGRTRDEHREVDGTIIKWDEEFDVGGEKMEAPSVGGSARNVCNCRCCLLQRAKWALDEDELETLQERADYFELDKSEQFNTFRKNYLKNVSRHSSEPVKSKDLNYMGLINGAKRNNIVYNPIKPHDIRPNKEEIINILAGGDMTGGSCASVGLAYIGQTLGYDVRDFRGGVSREFFSYTINLMELSHMDGMKVTTSTRKTSIASGKELLNGCEIGKEYYLCVGRHASIVRKTDEGVLQYLELQSANNSGWQNFDGNLGHTLSYRFGCRSGVDSFGDFMLNITDSNLDTDEFKSILGFLNTAENKQNKGDHGTIK
jgi:hypothetical protein